MNNSSVSEDATNSEDTHEVTVSTCNSESDEGS